MNEPNTEDYKVHKPTILKNKGFLGLLIVAILGAVAIFYFTQNRSSNELGEVLPPSPSTTVTAFPLPIVSNSGAAPAASISPLSPVPVSPALALPDSAPLDTLFETGVGYYQTKEYDKALDIFNEMLATDPYSARALDARGTVYMSLGDNKRALDDYNEAINADPLFPPAYFNRGRLYGLQKNYGAALADLQKSFDLAPLFFGYRANGNMGRIYHQQGEYDKALEAFTLAISYDDSKADTYYLRGETYTAMGNYESATSDYEAATSRFPDYYQAYQSLGYARYKTGQFDQAAEALNKALELSSNSPVAHFYLMLVYLAADKGNKAQAEVSQAMEAIGTLAEEDQNVLFKRVLADLETFAQENPDQAKEVEALINLIPQP